MIGLVYLIVNRVNGKRYVGKTVQTLSGRWKRHLSASRGSHSKSILHCAMRKYNEANFDASVIETCDRQFLSAREVYWIEHLQTFIGDHPNLGYNMTRGGEGEGRVMTSEVREKISRAKKGKEFSLDHKMRLSQAAKTRIVSDETKAKLSAQGKKHRHTEDTKVRMSISQKGRKKPREQKMKISVQVALVDSNGVVLAEYDSIVAAAKLNKTSPHAIKKSVETQKPVSGMLWKRLGGIMVSEETKQRLSISRRARDKGVLQVVY